MKFRKKPVVIDAVQWNGVWEPPVSTFVKTGCATTGKNNDELSIETLEGWIRALPGDWIIRGIKGEFYPCKPDIFAATYEPVDAPAAPREGEGTR